MLPARPVALILLLAPVAAAPSPRPPALQAVAPERMQELQELRELLERPEPEARERGLVGLGQFGSGASLALEPALACLDDPDVDVRRAAAEVAGKLGGAPEVVLRALALALDDHDWEVRQNAVRSAHALGEDALEGLVPWLADPRLGPGALEILCTDRPNALSRAESALVQPHLVPKAVDLLQVDGHDGFPGLSRALMDDNARPLALRALRRLGAAKPLSELALTELLRESRTDDAELLLLASVALSGGAPPGVPTGRLQELAAHEEGCVRALALWAFGRRGTQSGNFIPLLTAGLDDPAPEVRRAAAYGLGMLVPRERGWTLDVVPGAGMDVGRFGGLGVVPGPRVLNRASRGSPRLRRWRGMWIEWPTSLGPVAPGGEPPAALGDACEALARVAREGDAPTARAALWALGQAGLGAARARGDVIAVVADAARNVAVRRDALGVLARSGNWPEGPSVLEGLARSETPSTRALGLEGLGLVGARASVDVVGEALASDDEDVRTAALEALARLEPLPDGLLEPLALLFRTGERRAAGLLPGFGPAALEVLEEGLQSPHPPTRAVAAIALERIGRRARPSLDALRARLDDPDEDVRTAVRQTVRVIAPRRKKD